MNALEKLEAAASETAAAKRELESRIAAEKREAHARIDAEINAKHQAEWSRVYKASNDAARALHDFTVSTASHPFEGKRIVRRYQRAASRYSSRYVEAVEIGWLEVRRDETRFAGNMSRWRIPDYGRAFIRLAKQDGTPGVAIWRGHVPTDRLPDEWELAEEKTA